MKTNPPVQPHHEIEMPAPSFWPIVLAFGLLLMAVGVIFSLIISLVGVIILLAALVGWTLENRAESGDADAYAGDAGDADAYAGDAGDADAYAGNAEAYAGDADGSKSHGAAVYDTKAGVAGTAGGGKGKHE